ncbi:MAG: phosphotransferase family protein [Gammaproteobacteria bacterium]|nr:phosphotransferase family protein [Rhodospirillaceae bacterium]MDE0365207.1 phosphotransferase family protein [Gammaproteobacteria bacterium]
MGEIDIAFAMGRKGQDRDLNRYRDRFANWCAIKFEGKDLVELEPMAEDANGRAGEMYVFTLNDDSRFVLRKKATGDYLQHLDQDFESEYVAQRELRKNNLPVCKTWFYEEDESIVGSPFYVMEYVDGQIPPDETSYHLAGWMADLSVDEQAQLCRNSLAALASVHRLEPGDLSLGRLFERARPGYTHLDWMLDHWRRYHVWTRGDAPYPEISRALEWLSTNKIQNEPLSISWGDSRPGNTIYRGTECVALIDWEIVHLAAAEKDLAWWLTIDFMCERRAGNKRLPGWLSVEELIAAYEEASEQAVDRDRLHYYTVFAGMAAALFIERTMSIVPDVTEEHKKALMASPELSPLTLLTDIMDNQLW